MSNKALLEKLAEINTKIVDNKEKKNFQLENVKYIDFYENGLEYSLLELKKFAKSVMSSDDIKNFSSIDDFFNVLIEKSNQNIEQNNNKSKEILELQFKQKEIVQEILGNAEKDNNVNFVSISQFERPHKAINAFRELSLEYPDKFQFEHRQILSLDHAQNSVEFILHGDLEELRDTIKESKNSTIKYLKSITGKYFDNYFKSHLEKNVLVENDKIISLSQIDNEEFNNIYPSKKKRKNKI
tara:strand:- start:5 stop:727 length:723 start_codon:yes stop_codon:yes gene_type:complete